MDYRTAFEELARSFDDIDADNAEDGAFYLRRVTEQGGRLALEAFSAGALSLSYDGFDDIVNAHLDSLSKCPEFSAWAFWNSLGSAIASANPALFGSRFGFPRQLGEADGVKAVPGVKMFSTFGKDWKPRAQESGRLARILAELSSQTAPPPKENVPRYLGNKRCRIGNDTITLTDVQDYVISSLITLGSATKDELVRDSGVQDAPRVLKTICENYPQLAPFITLPGGKGKGGYRTQIAAEKGV